MLRRSRFPAILDRAVRRPGGGLLALSLLVSCVSLNDRSRDERDAGKDASGGAAGSAGSAGTGNQNTGGSSGRDAGPDSGGNAGTAGTAGTGGVPFDGGIDADLGDASVPRALTLSGDLTVHDPAIIATASAFYVLSTGPGIEVRRSFNLTHWAAQGRVFAANPAWIATRVSNVRDLWAPDIARFGGLYHLYYSASTFGSRDSCIGHAVTTNLDTPAWTDRGPVVCTENSDDYNAIDPNVVIDDAGQPWLSFGSFWSGIKLIPLDQNGFRSGTSMTSIASRLPDEEAIEAPYIMRHAGYYYLFVSFDLCCRAASSTYKIFVGRSTSVTGPYMDAEGTPLLEGGGTQVLLGDTRFRGPGHNSILSWDGHDFLVYHAYDATRAGAQTLRIAEFVWQDEWPLSGGP
ncbi:MAG TPA: arabinan endo-1,5-alpha-L-arabinosidase [Polyangiaceae bacterium]